MKQPISIFIMDVSNSTDNNWEEIAEYVQGWEKTIHSLRTDSNQIKVHHRMGDEILFVAKNFSTAYIAAFFILLTWKFKKQTPYFGFSFGYTESNLEKIQIDSWNHPLIKRAREQNEKIKNSRIRETTMIFDIDEKIADSHQVKDSKETLNLLAQIQSKLLYDQTDQQRLICSLYSILREQKKIAHLLQKTSSTISSHYKKGQSELILQIFYKLIDTLNILQAGENAEKTEDLSTLSKEFATSIRGYMKTNFKAFYPNL
ncbi:hypothetical protein J2T56_000282 [Natronobacillus azotifigens]|uniref:Uncharacterized protein n=1 Tax=Natronobacillus azotifigens TaxID=472978 RepID=A0A9J6R9A3_9BACI|nr:hypothetical protein [Natronobacillus azotifigens]MCZ0701942.1 hypothetical protein [Natronobacillus azotifigens]